MPGFKYHDATGSPLLMNVQAYRKGLVAPDYAKKIKNKEDFLLFVIDCNPKETPSFEDFQLVMGNSHFGYSSLPQIEDFLALPLNFDLPFWKGYYTHLIGDKMAYQDGAVKMQLFSEDSNKIGKDEARKILHNDWNKLNSILDKRYNIRILPEIEALNVVQYSEGIPRYVDCKKLIEEIERIRNSSWEQILKMI